jgi:hypothetical protein
VGSLYFVTSYQERKAQSFHPRRAATISMSLMLVLGVRLKYEVWKKERTDICHSASNIDRSEAQRIGGDCAIHIRALAHASKRLALRNTGRQITRRECYT